MQPTANQPVAAWMLDAEKNLTDLSSASALTIYNRRDRMALVLALSVSLLLTIFNIRGRNSYAAISRSFFAEFKTSATFVYREMKLCLCGKALLCNSYSTTAKLFRRCQSRKFAIEKAFKFDF